MVTNIAFTINNCFGIIIGTINYQMTPILLKRFDVLYLE